MQKILPNKWIRKAISEAINDILVNGEYIPCYDSRATGPSIPNFYTVMSTQSNTVDKGNKCEYLWNSDIVIDVFTKYDLPGNTGSRVMCDDISDAVRDEVQNLELDPLSDLKVVTQEISFPQDIYTATNSEIVYRKIINLNLIIQ